MNVKLALVTGETYSLELDIDKPLEFLSKIRPIEVFQRPVYQFLGKLKTVSINPECVEWIQFDTEDMPPTAPFAKNLTLRQLSPAAFKSWVSKNKVAITAAMEFEQQKNYLLAYGMASFKSGRPLYLEIRAKIEGVDERVKASQKIFSMPALFVYGETNGVFLINTRNIVTWQVVPGLKKSILFALPGELLGVEKA